MKRIILDTNFLMIPFQFNVDIFSELERICHFNYGLFVFDAAIRELKKIIEVQAGKSKKAAILALKLVKSKNVKILESEENYVDKAILENLDKDVIVATQDKVLRKKLLEKGISVIMLRQRKYLQMIERKLYK
ncbi:DUF188 domain-containing protein [Candidatus Woesearchaeota archaeon]|nr:DUF188 domain-containing protein [Candidatus Woesearchaeota archaeon]